MDASSSRSK
jgi:hypothetical protein